MKFHRLHRNLSADLRIDSDIDIQCSLTEFGDPLISPDTDLLRDLCVISFFARHKDDVSLLWFMSFSKYAFLAVRTRFVTLFLCLL